MTVEIFLLGSYDFARELDDLIADIPRLRVIGFIENIDRGRCGQTIQGKPVHWVDELSSAPKLVRLIASIGSTKRRRFIEQVEPFRVEIRNGHPSRSTYFLPQQDR